jgi:hypothetical protein
MPILLKSLLNEYVPGYIEDEDEDEQPLKSVKDILALSFLIASSISTL